jgi:hypothetical protein
MCLNDPEKKLFLNSTKNKPEIVEIFKHIKSLTYDDRPNYNFIKIHLDSLRAQELIKNSSLNIMMNSNNMLFYDCVKKTIDDNNVDKRNNSKKKTNKHSIITNSNNDNRSNFTSPMNGFLLPEINNMSNLDNSGSNLVESLLLKYNLIQEENLCKNLKPTNSNNKLSLFSSNNKKQNNGEEKVLNRKRVREEELENKEEINFNQEKKSELEYQLLNILMSRHNTNKNTDYNLKKLQANLVVKENNNNNNIVPKKEIKSGPLVDDKLLITGIRNKLTKKNSTTNITTDNKEIKIENKNKETEKINNNINNINVNNVNNLNNLNNQNQLRQQENNINPTNININFNNIDNNDNTNKLLNDLKLLNSFIDPLYNYPLLNRMNQMKMINDLNSTPFNNNNNINFSPNFLFGNVYYNLSNNNGLNPMLNNLQMSQMNNNMNNNMNQMSNNMNQRNNNMNNMNNNINIPFLNTGLDQIQTMNMINNQMNMQNNILDPLKQNLPIYQQLLWNNLLASQMNMNQNNEQKNDLNNIINDKSAFNYWGEMYKSFNM